MQGHQLNKLCRASVKFQDHRFLKVFTIYGLGGHLILDMSPRCCEQPFVPLRIKFGFDWSSSFGEEDD